MSIASLAGQFWTTPESRGSALLISAILCWTLDATCSPTTASLSG